MERLSAAVGIDHSANGPIGERDQRSELEWIEAIESTEVYQKFADAYRGLTGLPVVFRAPQVWGLALNGAPNEGPLCAWMSQRSGSCAACLSAQMELNEVNADETRSTPCPFGLTDSAVPVKVGNQLIGYLQTGQVATGPLDTSHIKDLRDAARAWGADAEEAVDALRRTRQMEPERYQSALSLLEVFAGQLSDLANRMLIQGANREPALIRRAKEYIRQHFDEELSLAKVAQAVNASTFYLCKMFKKSTGLHFTDYISRVRIEHARQRLANPNLRVSEIAYDVGFQSLTHFNRVFRNVMGQSPTQYRQGTTQAESQEGVALGREPMRIG